MSEQNAGRSLRAASVLKTMPKDDGWFESSSVENKTSDVDWEPSDDEESNVNLQESLKSATTHLEMLQVCTPAASPDV